MNLDVWDYDQRTGKAVLMQILVNKQAIRQL